MLKSFPNPKQRSAHYLMKIMYIQHQSVFSEPMNQSIYTNATDTTNQSMLDILFTEEDIMNAIDEFSNNSASGPDRLSAILMKQFKKTISKPLYVLWRTCLDNGITPSDLKIGHIIPIHKGGHQGLASNYRPIALTSNLIKVFEKLFRTILFGT